MNLRTLKKLSKQAAPLLPLLGDMRKQFPAEQFDNYSKAFIGDRKHWERSPCHPTYQGRDGWRRPNGAEIVLETRAGTRVVLRPTSHPRKGTIMVGSVSGYYKPEWDEEAAWDSLRSAVLAHFTDWSGEQPVPLRCFARPADILQGARDIIVAHRPRSHGARAWTPEAGS